MYSFVRKIIKLLAWNGFKSTEAPMKLVNCWQPLKCLRYIHEVIVHSTIDNENVHLKKDHVDSKGIVGLDRECGTGGR